MANPIVSVNATQSVPPTPSTLQKTGAMISQGGTTTAQGTKTLITQISDLTAILTAPLSVTGITWSGGVATVTTAAPHGITFGDVFLTTIAGAVPAVYDGTFSATASGTSTFTYPLASDGGVTPPTGTITYTERNVAELLVRGTSFFAQGSQQPYYVLELGAGEPAAGISYLTTWIAASPQFFYAYLVPKSWDGLSAFVTLANLYTAVSAKTYFFTSSASATYPSYAGIKSIYWQVPSPTTPTTESGIAAAFYILLNYAPSSTNRVTPFEYSYVFGITPYPPTGNTTTVAAIQAAGGNYIGTGAEGGISTSIIFGGQFGDGNPVNYWYAVDWAQINIKLNQAAAVINGSNNPQNPLYYNQDGINRLQQAAATTLNNGVSYGLVLFNVKQTALVQTDFISQLDNEAFVGYTVINAVPFIPYSAANPSNYKTGLYDGFSVQMTPLRGFDAIVFNMSVTEFVAA